MRQSMARRDGVFEAQAVGTFAEERGAHEPLEVFVPQAIQPLLSQQLGRHLELFADHQELGVRRRALSRIPLSEMLARGVLEVADEVPVGDVLHAVHADAVDLEILHPALEERQHVLPRG